MNGQQPTTLAEEVARAADLVDEMNLLRTLEDIPCEHTPRTASRHSATSVRATLSADMVKNADIGVGGSYQPMVYAGGAPLVVDEPCVILRPNPYSNNE